MAQKITRLHLTSEEASDISWIHSAVDQSPNAFFDAFTLNDKQRAHQRYLRMIKNSNLNAVDKKNLLRKFETWKTDFALQFWLDRETQSSQMRTAGVLIKGSEPYAEASVLRNAARTSCGIFYSPNISDDDSKRRKDNCPRNAPDEETTTPYSQFPSSTWHFEGSTTPPSHRPQSPSLVYQNRTLSPGSPTVRQMPLKNVFDISSQEELTERKEEALVSLNQLGAWRGGDVDLLSKFNNFRSQQPQSRYSLALDGIADVTPGSAFHLTLSQEQRILANTISFKEVDERWPTLSSILSRVCAHTYSYENVVEALRKEDANDPLVDYLRAITYNYSHYLAFSDHVPRNINEREGFGDLTWPFIRGALTLVNIPSRCFEIPVIGTKDRKNYGRDHSVETEEQAPMADGVAFFEDHQIYLAEASLMHEAKLDKQVKDKFKTARRMRDSWNSQIRSIAREAVPPTGLTVFGSTSFGDETKFYAMDFVGTYRLKQVGRMLVPLRKSHFASRMEICIRSCLSFALDLQGEVKRRTHLMPTNEDLTAACDMIVQTRTTPTKEVKKRRVSGI